MATGADLNDYQEKINAFKSHKTTSTMTVELKLSQLFDDAAIDYKEEKISLDELKKLTLSLINFNELKKEPIALEYSLEYKFIKEMFIPGFRGDGKSEFYTLGILKDLLDTRLNPEKIKINELYIAKALINLGVEISYCRRPYEVVSSRGYWLEPTKKMLSTL